MWIFLNDAFFSIVADMEDPEVLVVRARVQGDLERTFGSDLDIIESDDSDYRFRVFLYRDFVAHVIHEKVLHVDYYNFKSSIAKDDKDRNHFYLRVWAVMENWQSKIFGSNWNKWYLNYRNR
jgi:hypothetical protein